MLDRGAAQLLRVACLGSALQVLLGFDFGLTLLHRVGLGLGAFAGGLAVALARFIGRIEGVPDGHETAQHGESDGRFGVEAQ